MFSASCFLVPPFRGLLAKSTGVVSLRIALLYKEFSSSNV